MDYSVAVIPVTKADMRIDLTRITMLSTNWTREIGKLLSHSRETSATWTSSPYIDGPDAYDGVPVGLQIVARKHEEEKVWAIAKIIGATLNAANVRWYSGLIHL